MSKWLKKDDKVVVIAGNDKGRVGKILSKRGQKVIVQGVNMRKKHMKKTQQTQTAQIIEIEMPINISNVCFSSNDNNPVKVRSRVNKNKERELFYLENEKEVVLRMLKKAR